MTPERMEMIEMFDEIERRRIAGKMTCPECSGDAYPYRNCPERICYSCGFRWEGPVFPNLSYFEE